MTTLREELEKLADNSPTFRDPQDREEAMYAQKLDRKLALAAANLALEHVAASLPKDTACGEFCADAIRAMRVG